VATYWLKGFLCGNEPGPPADGFGDRVDDPHPEYIHWQESINVVFTTGFWDEGERSCENCGECFLLSLPQELCVGCSTK